jgi:5'-nucleotidase
MADRQPVILITNDDGIAAPGISNLVAALKGLGRLVVVAPDSPQSGMGHAITIGTPLRLSRSEEFRFLGAEAWQCNGTPVDCVKIARNVVLGFKPDICVSGINHGSNASINVIYSGTMSAAMEAAIEGIPAAGFSLMDFRYDADFTVARIVARKAVQRMLAEHLPEHLLLNINIPAVSKKDFKGIRVCRQAHARWQEEFEERTDPRGKKYYWMTGKFINNDLGEDTDMEALKNGYASIVPITTDFTENTVRNWLGMKLRF